MLLQKRPIRESAQRQMSCSSSGSLSPSNQAANAPKVSARREWKYIASEKTTSKCFFAVTEQKEKKSILVKESRIQWAGPTLDPLYCNSHKGFFPALLPLQVALTLSNLAPRQHLPVSGRAGRRAVCDLPARTQQPSDVPLLHPLPDEEPQLRGPARGAGGAAALAHALRSLGPGHRSPQREIRRGRSVSPMTCIKRGNRIVRRVARPRRSATLGLFFFFPQEVTTERSV